jgi:uncharacterized membrane protein YhaH (DUF805 family)
MNVNVPWWVVAGLMALIGIGTIIASSVEKWDGAPIAIGAGIGAVAAAIWAFIRRLAGSLKVTLTLSSGEVVTVYRLHDLDWGVMSALLVGGGVIGAIVMAAM